MISRREQLCMFNSIDIFHVYVIGSGRAVALSVSRSRLQKKETRSVNDWNGGKEGRQDDTNFQ
jgi:hypothetical protein